MTPVPLNSFKEPNREIASLRGKLPSVNFMTQRSAQEIVRNALEKDELDLLLVGIPEYQFLPKWSPASGNTDLTYLLDALYMGIADYTREELASVFTEQFGKSSGLMKDSTRSRAVFSVKQLSGPKENFHSICRWRKLQSNSATILSNTSRG